MQDLLLSHSLTVVTYGGGEILTKIFQAIAMFFNNGEDGIVRPLMVICASLGGFYALTKAFFSSSFEALILRYYFPLLVIGFCFLVPTTTVHIEDILTKVELGGKLRTSSYSVSHVPLLLGKFAEIVSSIGYQLSEKIEKVMHMPNDPSYNATGMIFGSETALDMSRYQISNANLEQNLRLFSKQCVLYDIALGRYSLDDLRTSTDLWRFFEDKTSQVRMIRYCPPDGGGNLKLCTYESCKDAIVKMKPFFDREKEKYAKLEIGRNLPLTFQALTGFQQSSADAISKELIGQQLTLNVLTDVLSKGNFAKKRAYDQQQSTYRTLGALAANGLVTMRVVFEALIYASFVFILPLSLFAGGLKYLFNWAWLVIWIQLWPPLYTILNYVMLLAARAKFGGWFSGIAASQQGLSLFTSIGMQNLNDEIFALAGFLGASVPYLSFILLKGGISSFVQLASSLTAPAQNAASSAAAEQASGNYSFANTSFGQMSYDNTSAFQTQMAPSVSSGYFIDNQGDISTTFSQNASPVLNQSSSVLRTSIMSDEVIGKSFQAQKQEAQSDLRSITENFMDSLSVSSRSSSDYISHLAHADNFSDSYSDRKNYAVQESANYLQSVAESWGRQYGFGARESLDILANAALSGGLGKSFLKYASIDAKMGVGGSGNRNASREDMINSALGTAQSESFQKHFQQINDFARSQASSSSIDTGTRESHAYAQSLDQLYNKQSAYQSSESYLQQISENESWFKQNSHLIKQSLNDAFIAWANDRFEGGYSQVRDILSRDQSEEIQPLVQEFIQSFVSQRNISSLTNKENFHAQVHAGKMEVGGKGLEEGRENIIQKLATPLWSGDKDSRKVEILQEYQAQQDKYSHEKAHVQDKLDQYRNTGIERFDQNNEHYLLGRLWDGLDKSANLSSKFKINEASFWMNGEE
jgi:conjugal transfer mating pair stabilization protein TraG